MQNLKGRHHPARLKIRYENCYRHSLIWVVVTFRKTLGPDWLQHDRCVTCVIAQQYSSSHYVFIPASKKFVALFKIYCIIFLLLFLNCAKSETEQVKIS